MQDRHRSPGLLQLIPNLVLGVDPGYIFSFMTMLLKFNFIHYQHTWSALVVGSRILTQFSLQGKYCNISAMQIGADIFRLYNLIYLRDWMAEGRLTHIWKLIFFLRIMSTRSSGILAQLPTDPWVHVIRPDLVVLANIHTNKNFNNGIFLFLASLSLSSCPLLPHSPTLEIKNLETARMRSLLCKEGQENWLHDLGLCIPFSQEQIWYYFLIRNCRENIMETVLASCLG